LVSQHPVKTHTSRVFDKLGANRRTQAVQLAKSHRLIAWMGDFRPDAPYSAQNHPNV